MNACCVCFTYAAENLVCDVYLSGERPAWKCCKYLLLQVSAAKTRSGVRCCRRALMGLSCNFHEFGGQESRSYPSLCLLMDNK